MQPDSPLLQLPGADLKLANPRTMALPMGVTRPEALGLPPHIPPAALLAAIIESADDAIISKDLNGVVTSWNGGAERMFGYSATEMIGQSILKLLPPERHHEEPEILARLARGEKIDHHQTVRMRKNGQRFPVSLTVSPVRGDDGSIVGASKVARDMSVQNRAAEVSGLLSAIVQNSDDAIISKDLNGVITSWNRGAERLFGYTPEEMIGQPIWRLFPPDRWNEEPVILDRIRRGEVVDHFETKRVRKGGAIIDVSVTISPIRDSEGKITGASKIARDITAEKSARDKLIHAHAELLRADQMKSEFLATLSHELRTPLNAILGWTQVLKETNYEDRDELSRAVEIIERNARAQAQMIQDLLDVSRIVSGKVTLDIRQLDLPAVVEAALQSLHPAAQAKHIKVSSAFSSVEGFVMGDKDRLQQVVWNLVSNALKFTPKGGRVHVTICRRNSHVEIAVSDNGQGIRAEFLPHVFERFRQADASTTRRHGGLGLGLSIAKQLIEMHGGEIRADSAGEGKGSTFTIAIPIMASRPVPASSGATSPGGDSDTVERFTLDRVRVLALDDEPDSLELVRRILESRNAEVRTAESASKALEMLEDFKPDIILSDVGMPEMDGYEFIRRVRAHRDRASTPAVALTALARSEDRTRALKAGFQTHVAKPVEPAELVAVVASLVSLSAPKG